MRRRPGPATHLRLPLLLGMASLAAASAACTERGEYIDAPPDHRPPVVTWTDPWPGQPHFPILEPIEIDFDENLARRTVHSGSVTLVDVTRGRLVPARVEYDDVSDGRWRPPGHPRATGHRITVTPESPLAEDTEFVLQLGRTITDLAGNPMRPEPPIAFSTSSYEDVSYRLSACGVSGRVVRVDDIDADGFDDLVSVEEDDSGLSVVLVLFGPDLGRAAASSGLPTWVLGDVLDIGDIDGDGAKDVVVRVENAKIGDPFVAVLFGPDLDRRVDLRSRIQDPHWYGRPLVVGDIDGDGLDDVVVKDGVWGAGHFTAFHGPDLVRETSIPWPAAVDPFAILTSPLIVDLDLDGHADLLAGAPTLMQGGGIVIFRGPDLGTSGVLASPFGSEVYSFAGALQVGDITGDGLPEILANGVHRHRGEHVIVELDGQSLVLRRVIRSSWKPQIGAERGSLRLLDLDGDGVVDIARSDGRTPYGTLRVLLGPGFDRSIELGAPEADPARPSPHFGASYDMGDLDADGRVDVLIAAPPHVAEDCHGRQFPIRRLEAP